MAEITGGELLVRCLANEGVKHLFGLPCPEADPILAALDAHGIRFVPVRHEAAGVHMAEGLYKTSGQVSAVLGNPGPGSANLLPGVITARHEGVPVIVITAQHRLGIVYPSPPSTFQGQDQLDVFRPTVKWGGPILSWDRIPDVTRIAFRELWLGRPGPVHLEVPMPVVYATGNSELVPILAPERYRAPLPQPSDAALERAAELLSAATRPLVISGAGVDRAGANGALLRIVEALGCPVLTTMAGRSTFPLDHPNHLYGYGPGADAARREADVVLVAGSRLGNLDLPFDKYWGDPSHAKIIQIDIDARHIGVTRPLELGIVADLATSLDGLSRRLERASGKRSDGGALASYQELARAAREKQMAAVTSWSGPGIHPAHALETIGSVFGRDAIYVADGGMTSLWSHWFLPPTQPRSYHNILELGMLGTGIPSAIGARLAEPSRDVVCVTGRRGRRLQLHGDAVRGARGAEAHDHRLRRRLVDDGGAERANALRQDLRHRDGRGALGPRRRGTGLSRALRREAGRARARASRSATLRRADGDLREDQSRREPRGSRRSDAPLHRGLLGSDVASRSGALRAPRRRIAAPTPRSSARHGSAGRTPWPDAFSVSCAGQNGRPA